MPKIVCVSCEKQYKMVESGLYVIDMFLNPPQPYKIWSGDKWECPGCGHQVMAGFGDYPLAEHFQAEKFPKLLKRIKDDEAGVYCYER